MISQPSSANGKLRRLVRPYYNAVRSRLLFDTSHDYRRSVFLSAGSRTGSTWISELINFSREFRFMFEPITLFCQFATSRFAPYLPDVHDGVQPYMRGAKNWLRPALDDRLLYIRPGCADAELLRKAEEVLTGRFRHPEVDQYNYTLRLFFSKRLIKETKSNLWVRWLYKQFPGLKIVFLMRHPIATIQSRQYTKRIKDQSIRVPYYQKLFFGQPDLVHDYLEPFRSVLEGANSMFEQRLAIWCIQYYVPLRQFGPGEIHIAFYEDFCLDPLAAATELLTYIGEPPSKHQLETVVERMQRPSSTAKPDASPQQSQTDRIDPMHQLKKWQTKIADEDYRCAKAMLGAFGLDRLYSVDDPLPKKDALPRMMRAQTAAAGSEKNAG